MISPRHHYSLLVIIAAALSIALSPFASSLASTPEAEVTPPPVVTAEPTSVPPPPPPAAPEPPVTPEAPVTEPLVPQPPVTEPPAAEPPATEPPVTEPPVTQPPVTEPPATEPPATEPPGEDEASETETPTSEATEEPDVSDDGAPEGEVEEESQPATPTPTEEVVVPDELQVVGDKYVTIYPSDHKDVVVRYTLGSDREKTEMSATLTAPNGESLDDWSLVPWQRADLDNDPQDANRHLKARIDFADSLDYGDVYQTTWRVTAPDHIEEPVTVRLHLSTKIHREDGVTEGVIKKNLVNFNAVASEHIPTLTCDEVVSEDVDNTWNCAFDTTHPDDDVVITASAEVPEGWQLTLDDALLSSEPLVLSAEAIAADSFTLAARYPIGCPDIGAIYSASMSLSMTYPSGEVSELNTELPLVFERPTPTFEITSFEFDEIDLRETLSTTGRLTVSYEGLPCAWQASLQLTDLESDMFTIPGDLIRIETVDGLPNANVSIVDGSISIIADESTDEDTSGVFTIHFAIDLPHQIPPGAYRIGVTTQFGWDDQN